jgi:hypothetical protein
MIEIQADLRETFLCFAYGSNMLTRRLSARTPSAVPLATAYVDGYRLKAALTESGWDEHSEGDPRPPFHS